MEIAILILVITSLLILGATCFFSFQIWIQSKELKINISSMNDEIKKINTELNSNLNSKINLIQNIISEELEKICKKMQELNDQNIKLENNIGNTKNFLNEQVEIKLKSSEKKIIDSFNSHGFSLENTITEQNMKLEKVIESDQMHKGITATAGGFYGPQGRVLRLSIQDEALNSKMYL